MNPCKTMGLLGASLVWLSMTSVHAQGIGEVYSTNEGSQSISVIDGARNVVVDTLTQVGKPRGLTLCPGGHTLYVSDQQGEQLLVIDTRSRQTVARVAVGDSPEAVYCSPKGDLVAVTNEESNSVSFIATSGLYETFAIRVQHKNPEHAVFSPDGRHMLVSAEESDHVDVLDLTTRKQVASISVGQRPRGIAFTADGKRAFVAVETDNRLVVIDMTTRKVTHRLQVGMRTNGLVMHPNGRVLFASNGGDANVVAIDAQSLQVLATVPVGQRPWNMSINPEGTRLYVACGRSHAVSVVDAVNFQPVQNIAVGRLPWGTAAN